MRPVHVTLWNDVLDLLIAQYTCEWSQLRFSAQMYERACATNQIS